MQLYLIRHAQSANNSQSESRRVEDPGITPLGHQQARAVAGWIGPLRVDVLVTSAFRRTLETTQHIAEALDVVPQIWRDLHEVGGCYSGYLEGQEQGRPGMSYDEIASAFPAFKIDPLIGREGWWGSKPYETMPQAMHRADRMLTQFIQWYGESGDTVVAVIHADFKVCLLRHILGDDFVEQTVGPIMNTGICKFSFKSGQWRLDLFNSISHLRPRQIS